MYIELSYPISADMPVYPGSPQYELIPVKRISKGDHANTTIVKMFTHSGTHVDAPYHFYEKGETIDKIPIDHFVYEYPLIIHKELKKGQLFKLKDVKDYGHNIYTADILFFYTGYCKLRDSQELYEDDFPAISEEVAKFIRTELLNLKAIAIDTSSIESPTMAPKTNRIVHRTLLDGDLYNTRPLLIYEDVNIEVILNQHIKKIYCFPLRLVSLDAYPVNMVAEI